MRVTLPFIFGPYDYPEILCFSAFSFGQSGKFDFALGYSLSIIDALITKCKEKSFFIFVVRSFLLLYLPVEWNIDRFSFPCDGIQGQGLPVSLTCPGAVHSS